MQYDPELFTTNPQEGFIEIIRKEKLQKKLANEPECTAIVLSGWVNHPCYRYEDRVYVLFYLFSASHTVCIQTTNKFINLWQASVQHTSTQLSKAIQTRTNYTTPKNHTSQSINFFSIKTIYRNQVNTIQKSWNNSESYIQHLQLLNTAESQAT